MEAPDGFPLVGLSLLPCHQGSQAGVGIGQTGLVGVDHLEEVGVNLPSVLACLQAREFAFTVIAVSTEPDALFFHFEETLLQILGKCLSGVQA